MGWSVGSLISLWVIVLSFHNIGLEQILFLLFKSKSIFNLSKHLPSLYYLLINLAVDGH
jgi:hypothetical protein